MAFEMIAMISGFFLVTAINVFVGRREGTFAKPLDADKPAPD